MGPGQFTVEHLDVEAAVVQLQLVSLIAVPDAWAEEHNITTLQRSLSERGVALQGGHFPVQRIPVETSHEALRLCERLAARGVRGVPLSGGCRGRPAVGLIVTACHRRDDLRRVAAAVAGSLGRAA